MIAVGNLQEAVRYYKLAADRGDAEAQITLGEGSITLFSANLSFHLIVSILFFGPTHDAGHYYTNGTGVPRNLEEAIRLYKLAAYEGNAEAQCLLGTIL